MIPLRRRAATLTLEPGGPLHFGSHESLDALSMVLDEGHLWRVDPARFLGNLRSNLLPLFNARARSPDALRQCHAFMGQELPTARASIVPGSLPVRASAAVAGAHADFLAGRSPDAVRLALMHPDTLGPHAVLAGAHLKAAMSVAWAGVGPRRWTPVLPLRLQDCRLVAGRIEARAAFAGRLRTDARRLLPQARSAEWMVAGCPEDGARYAGLLAPVAARGSWQDTLDRVAHACNLHYRPRLQAIAGLLAPAAEHAPASPLASFLAWAREALARTAQEPSSCFVLQVGAFAGSAAHPGTGRRGSRHRLPVCLETGFDDVQACVQGARPMGWLLGRLGPAA